MDVSRVSNGHIDLSSASDSPRSVFIPEDESTKILRHVGNYLLRDTAYHPRKFIIIIIIIVVVVVVCIPKPSRRLRLTHFLMFKRKRVLPVGLFSKTIEILGVMIK